MLSISLFIICFIDVENDRENWEMIFKIHNPYILWLTLILKSL